MHDSVVERARALGLDYRFDLARVVNTFDAHRVLQLAKKGGLSDNLEEIYFRAYFTEGGNMADHGTLSRLAAGAGLDRQEVSRVLTGTTFTDEVLADINEARQLGARGVPFFVIDRKLAVAGAQDARVFLQTLRQAASEKELSMTAEAGN